MSSDLHPLGRMLIILGLLLTVIGCLLLVAPRMPWLGRLPGDIHIERDRFSFYFPLASSLLVSALLSLAFWVWGRFHR